MIYTNSDGGARKNPGPGAVGDYMSEGRESGVLFWFFSEKNI